MAITFKKIKQLINPNNKEWLDKQSAESIASILNAFCDLPKLSDSNTYKKKEVILPIVKGMLGEKYVEDMLKSKFNVDNVAQKGKMGDLIVNKKILVEIKDYSSVVAKKEVEKFYRDIKANSSIKAGLFVSLNSSISGISSHILYDHYNLNGERVPLIFLSNNNEEILLACVEILLIEINTRKKVVDIEDKIYECVDRIEENLDGLSMARNTIIETKYLMNRQLDKLTSTILNCEIKIKNQIENLRANINIEPLDRSLIITLKKLKSKFKIKNEKLFAPIYKKIKAKKKLLWYLGDKIISINDNSSDSPLIKIKLMKTKSEIFLRIDPCQCGGIKNSEWRFMYGYIIMSINNSTYDDINILLDLI